MGLSLVIGEYSRNGCGDRHAKLNSKIYIHAVLEAVNRVRNTRHVKQQLCANQCCHHETHRPFHPGLVSCITRSYLSISCIINWTYTATLYIYTCTSISRHE